MHHNNEVSVHTPGLTGDRSPAGVGWLVTPSVVVMRLPGRGATSGQPSHVTVPAASGGGRGGRDIQVLGMYDAPLRPGWYALALDAEADRDAVGEPPAELDLFSIADADDDEGAQPTMASSGGSLSAAADGGAVIDGWICRCFPSLPGCRR